eukprot:9227188-Pyramimonas_sp.AAC.1
MAIWKVFPVSFSGPPPPGCGATRGKASRREAAGARQRPGHSVHRLPAGHQACSDPWGGP